MRARTPTEGRAGAVASRLPSPAFAIQARSVAPQRAPAPGPEPEDEAAPLSLERAELLGHRIDGAGAAAAPPPPPPDDGGSAPPAGPWASVRPAWRDGAGSVRRKIWHDGTEYQKNDERPGWRKRAEDAMLDQYNARTGQSAASVDYGKKKLARAHQGSFDAIQEQIVAYLNDTVGQGAAFAAFVRDFIAELDNPSDERDEIDVALAALQASATGGSAIASVIADANSLLSLLNSLSTNLRAGDKYLNSSIGEDPDLLFEETPSGQLSANPQAKNLLRMGPDTWGDLPTTPGGSVMTSEGRVPTGRLSPVSASLVSGYPKKPVASKSKNVKDRLSGPSALSNFPRSGAGGPAAAPAAAGPVPAPPVPSPWSLLPPVPAPYGAPPLPGPPFGAAAPPYGGPPPALSALAFPPMPPAFAPPAPSGSAPMALPAFALPPLPAPPPPRYNVIRKVGDRLDGTEIYYDLDTYDGQAKYVRVQNNTILEVLGTVEPPRYEVIRFVGTLHSGDEIYYDHDTYDGQQKYVRVRNNTILEVLGTNPPPRYQSLGRLSVNPDGTEVYSAHDMATNSVKRIRVQGTTVLGELP